MCYWKLDRPPAGPLLRFTERCQWPEGGEWEQQNMEVEKELSSNREGLSLLPGNQKDQADETEDRSAENATCQKYAHNLAEAEKTLAKAT